MLRARCVASLISLGAIVPDAVRGEGDTGDASQVLPAVVIDGHFDNAVGAWDAASQGRIRRALLQSRPVLRPGEVLEFVPGLMVTQHSGDGKANQYFLRGFNLDHGTDFAVRVDGIPLNMPSHGHGQGYADANLLIPELVDGIEYRKGPYFASDGDFSLVGSADVTYRRSFERPFSQLTWGNRGLRRWVAGASWQQGDDGSLLAVVEGMRNNGPWTTPERLGKSQVVLKYSAGTLSDGWSTTVGAYQARWNATDQIPLRALLAGTMGRFDAVDPTDGGLTHRYSMSADWRGTDGADASRVSMWMFQSGLDLYGNLTYALDRPVTGDQVHQSDHRTAMGLRASRESVRELMGHVVTTEIGVQARQDQIDVGLSDTQARRPVDSVRSDHVAQRSMAVYGQGTVEWTPSLRTVTGLRADRFTFDVASAQSVNSGRTNASQLSPKLAIILGPWAKSELFLNAGRGFHSNDARGTTLRRDPRTGAEATPVPGLVAGTGTEIGLRTQILAGTQSSLVFWRLNSRSELVYVGDSGTTEPDRPGRRRGVEWNHRWSPSRWLQVDLDMAWTHARFAGGDDRIPGAVERTASLGVSAREMGPWSAGVNWRFLGSRPLVEDNSVRAPDTSLTNLRVARRFGATAELTLDVFNLFNRQVDDIQYFYESRLPGEPPGLGPDVHLHPSEPRSARLTLLVRF